MCTSATSQVADSTQQSPRPQRSLPGAGAGRSVHAAGGRGHPLACGGQVWNEQAGGRIRTAGQPLKGPTEKWPLLFSAASLRYWSCSSSWRRCWWERRRRRRSADCESGRNTIAFHNDDGVLIGGQARAATDTTDANPIRFNSIHSNGGADTSAWGSISIQACRACPVPERDANRTPQAGAGGPRVRLRRHW